jgi:hypothetical protein
MRNIPVPQRSQMAASLEEGRGEKADAGWFVPAELGAGGLSRSGIAEIIGLRTST